jgi:transposase
MSLHPQTDYPIPEETQRVARAAFPKGNLCLHLADVLGPLYQDQQFTALFHQRGQPGLSPARLAQLSQLNGFSDEFGSFARDNSIHCNRSLLNTAAVKTYPLSL